MAKAAMVNLWRTQLNGSLTDIATSVTLAAQIPAADLATITAGDYLWIWCGSEIIRLTVPSPTSGLTFVAARGRDGTSAAAHVDTTPVIVAYTRESLLQLRADAEAVSQPLDATLTALAGVSTAADKMPYFTGTDTASVATVTAAARTVLDDTTVAAMVDTLGGASSLGTGGLVRQTYVDGLISGMSQHSACRGATTTALTVTYSNGSSGVGATLTNAGAMAAFSVDGLTGAVGQRFLFKNQAAPEQNGIYTLTTAGSGAVNWVATRATDFDAAAANEVADGAYVLIEEGTTQAGTIWILAASGDTSYTIGTTALAWIELAVAPQTVTLTGDVTGSGAGSFATTTVKIQGVAVHSTAPTDAQFLIYDNADSRYEAKSLSGDATMTAAGAVTVTSFDGGTDIKSAAGYNVGTGALEVVLRDASAKVYLPTIYGLETVDTDGATVTFNLNTSNKHSVTLGGNRTLALSNASTWQTFRIKLTQDGTGSRTVTWFSGITWRTAGGSAPTLSTTPGAADVFVFECTGSGTYDGYPDPSSSFQLADATLTAFAALTIAANSLTIGTGADAFSQTSFAANKFPARASTGDLVAKDITDFGLSLVDDASAKVARVTMGVDQRTTVNNADYTILATDRNVAQTGTLSAPRTFTLPAASAVNAGQPIEVVDASGTITATNKITIARAGSDTINGATSFTFSQPYKRVRLISDGTSAWTADVGFNPTVVEFSAAGSGTILIPYNCKTIRIVCRGGSGAGGSGRRGAAGSARYGGGGGAGGGYSDFEFDVADLGGGGASLSYTVGNGGTLAAAITADDTNGNAGGNGAASTVSITSGGQGLVCASGGNGGAGGTNAAGTGGTAGGAAMFAGTAGGASAIAADPTAATAAGTGGGGGGAGGGIDASNVHRAGGGGAVGGRSFTNASGTNAGGAAGGSNGTPATSITPANICGGGGGGGGGNSAGVGGDGAAGDNGGGGGGGGASVNGSNSGAGAAGNDGLVRFIFK